MLAETTAWTGASIAIASGAIATVLAFALTEAMAYARRRRETKAAATLVFQELTSAYGDALTVAAGEVSAPHEVYRRRSAWEANAGPMVCAIPLEDSHRIAVAYSSLDRLDLILRAGAPGEALAAEADWIHENVTGDIENALRVLGPLAGHTRAEIDERIQASRSS
jgi:hypothetical protein